MLRALALSSTLAAGGCGGAVFACQTDVDCGGGRAGGVCAEGGVCSFPDGACDSGQRYGDHGGELSNQCVPSSATSSSGDPSTTVSASSPTSIDGSGPPDSSSDAGVDDGPATSSSGASTSSSIETSSEGTTGPELDPDLLVWLRFDGPAGRTVTNYGVLGGSASCLTGCPTQADGVARFDGLANCLAFPHHAELGGQPFTVAGWVRIANPTSGMFLFGKAFEAESQNTWELYVNYELLLGQRLGFEMYGPPDGVVMTDIAASTWVHVTGSWDGATPRLYLDGTDVGDFALDMSATDEHDVQFGCDFDNGAAVYFFDGWMSDVRVYGRALGPEDIAALASTIPPDPID